MRPGRSTLRLTLAVLLVGALFANPLGLAAVERSGPVGDAAAEHGSEFDCSVALLIGGPSSLGDDVCHPNAATSEEVAETWISMHGTAEQQQATSQTYLATYHNAILASNDTAFLRAEHAAVESYVAGLSKTNATDNAVQNVSEYVTVREKNLINAWNTRVATLEVLAAREGNVTGNQIEMFLTRTGGEDFAPDPGSAQFDSFGTRNVTLSNGEEMEVRTFSFHTTSHGVNGLSSSDPPDLHSPAIGITTDREMAFSAGSYNDVYVQVDSVHVNSPPDTDYLGESALYPFKWNNEWDRTQSLHDSVVTEAQLFVEGTWGEYQHNNVSASDLLSRLNKMENYQVNAGENATFNDVVAALAAEGFSTPKSSTGWMNLTYDREQTNTTVTNDGMLLSSTAPSGETWEVGTTYNSENISGVQMVATLNGSQHIINGTFAINGAYDREGNELDNTTISSPEKDYRVANVSELNEQIVLLGEQLAALENRTAGDGGGGIGWKYTGLPIPNPFGFLGSLGKWLVIGLAAFVALLLISVVN